MNKHILRLLALFAVPVAFLLGAGAAAAQPEQPVKYYVVPAPKAGAKVESLADIARKVLNNPNRGPEIAKLNADLVQPDGQKVRPALALKPGYVLQLPPDAAGPGVGFGLLSTVLPAPTVRPPAPTKPPAPPPAPPKPAPTTTPETPTAVETTSAKPSPTKPARKEEPDLSPPKPGAAPAPEDALDLPAELVFGVGTVVIAALGRGAWLLLMRRRHEADAPVESETHAEPFPEPAVQPQWKPEPQRAPEQEPEPLPEWRSEPVPVFESGPQSEFEHHRVSVGSASIDVRVAAHAASTIHYGQSGAFCLGENENGPLFLDVAEVPGVIAVDGDAESVDQLAELMVQELDLGVTLVGSSIQYLETSERVDGIADLEPDQFGNRPRLVVWTPSAPLTAREAEYLASCDEAQVVLVVLGEVEDAPLRLTITPAASPGKHASAPAERVSV